jgi:hypothetical protein
MNANPNAPDELDDPAAERLLAGAGRFSPQRGFEDRVVSRVRVPLPRWARALRDRFRALTSGVSGWTLLATFSVATAASWATGAALGVRYWGEISAVWDQSWGQVLGVVRGEVPLGLPPVLADARLAIDQWLAGMGLNMQTAAIGYGAVVLICAVALRLLTAEPAHGRGSNAAS